MAIFFSLDIDLVILISFFYYSSHNLASSIILVIKILRAKQKHVFLSYLVLGL